MARRAAYQTRYHNKAAIYIVLGTVLVFAVVLFINCHSLNEKKERLLKEQIQNEQEYAQEQQRTTELQELEKTTQTMKYYEKVAKEQLGMVYEDEIIFKESSK